MNTPISKEKLKFKLTSSGQQHYITWECTEGMGFYRGKVITPGSSISFNRFWFWNWKHTENGKRFANIKLRLTPADSDKVWKEIDGWVHYYWKNGEWRCAPCDPRTNTMLTNTFPAGGQVDGVIHRRKGLIEVIL